MRRMKESLLGAVLTLSMVSTVQADEDEGMTQVVLSAGTTLVKKCVGQQQLAVFDRAVAPGEQRSISDRLELNHTRLSNAQTIYVYCAVKDIKLGTYRFLDGVMWQNQASAGFKLVVSYPSGNLNAAFTAIGK